MTSAPSGNNGPSTSLLLVSIDGMRPDGLLQARTPTMDRVIAEGASTLSAVTVMPSVTLPCHTSMLRGVDVPRHGITTNVFQPLARPVPSLFEVAHAAGKRTGCFTNWQELRDMASPESVDVTYCFNRWDSTADDRRPAEMLARHLAMGEWFDLVFLYLGFTDACGHAHGWMSPDYLRAIEHADACLALALDAFASYQGGPTVLVVSDHGGHERTHGTDCREDMTIPWLAHGPGVRGGVTIGSPVRIYDTTPTAAHLLGVPQAREWEGRVVKEAVEG